MDAPFGQSSRHLVDALRFHRRPERRHHRMAEGHKPLAVADSQRRPTHLGGNAVAVGRGRPAVAYRPDAVNARRQAEDEAFNAIIFAEYKRSPGS